MMSSNSLGEVLTALLDDKSAQTAVIVPGEVTAWDSSTETATVVPQLLNRAGDSRPEVRQCPVVFPGAYWDIQIGETGLLLVCDEDFTSWWRTGERSAPATQQNHDIGNAVFLAGFRTRTNARTHATNVTVLDKPAAGGEVRLGDPTATKAALHEDLLGDLNTFLTQLNNWGTTAHANFAASVAYWTANVLPSLSALVNGIAAGSYQSPSVKVED
jgi:hypothetical protein